MDFLCKVKGTKTHMSLISATAHDIRRRWISIFHPTHQRRSGQKLPHPSLQKSNMVTDKQTQTLWNEIRHVNRALKSSNGRTDNDSAKLLQSMSYGLKTKHGDKQTRIIEYADKQTMVMGYADWKTEPYDQLLRLTARTNLRNLFKGRLRLRL